MQLFLDSRGQGARAGRGQGHRPRAGRAGGQGRGRQGQTTRQKVAFSSAFQTRVRSAFSAFAFAFARGGSLSPGVGEPFARRAGSYFMSVPV